MNVQSASFESSSALGKSRSVGGLLVAANVLLIPFTSTPVMRGSLTFVPYLIVLALIAAVITAAPNVVSLIRHRKRNPAVWLAVSIPGFMGIAALFHPSERTWLVMLFAVGGAALAVTIWTMSRPVTRRYVVYPLLLVASIESTIAILQMATERAVVPPWLATGVAPKAIDGVIRVQGTMTHTYVLAAISLLAIGCWAVAREPGERTPYPAAIALGLSSAMIAITFSRAALLALISVLLVLAIQSLRGDRGLRLAVLTITIASTLTVALTFASWAERVEHSMTSDLDDATLGRVTLLAQAATLITSEPIVGIGPGRYGIVLQERELDYRGIPYVVHTVPIAFAAENGIPAGLVMTISLAWLGLAAIRAGPGAVAAYLGILPILLLDVLHYVSPAGQLMLGIWLGVLAAGIRWRSDDRQEHP